jgi:hypothetical protein
VKIFKTNDICGKWKKQFSVCKVKKKIRQEL